jgi:hypothetical protein
MNIILEIIRYIEETKNKVQALPVSAQTQVLKETTLSYYEQFVIYHSALLRKMTNPDSIQANEAASKAITGLESWEDEFNRQIERLSAEYPVMNEYRVEDKVAVVPATDIFKSDIQESLNEYNVLVDQVKELIEINEALKKESEDLILKNNELFETLKAVLEKSIEYLTLEQRQVFLQYLKGL